MSEIINNPRAWGIVFLGGPIASFVVSCAPQGMHTPQVVESVPQTNTQLQSTETDLNTCPEILNANNPDGLAVVDRGFVAFNGKNYKPQVFEIAEEDGKDYCYKLSFVYPDGLEVEIGTLLARIDEAPKIEFNQTNMDVEIPPFNVTIEPLDRSGNPVSIPLTDINGETLRNKLTFTITDTNRYIPSEATMMLNSDFGVNKAFITITTP